MVGRERFGAGGIFFLPSILPKWGAKELGAKELPRVSQPSDSYIQLVPGLHPHVTEPLDFLEWYSWRFGMGSSYFFSWYCLLMFIGHAMFPFTSKFSCVSGFPFELRAIARFAMFRRLFFGLRLRKASSPTNMRSNTRRRGLSSIDFHGWQGIPISMDRSANMWTFFSQMTLTGGWVVDSIGTNELLVCLGADPSEPSSG